RNANALPQVKHVEVKLSNLPAHLDGFTIVQISDLHVSATIRRPYVERVVAMSNALKPDLVALTGDLMDGSVPQLRDEIAPLADLTSRFGSLFCTGNHEYYSGVEPWLVELRRIGIRTLRNEHVEIGALDDAQGLIVAGIDDAQAARFGGGHGPDVARALSGVATERAVVLLAHQPKSVHEAAEHAVDLQLSGHTHGGQIWPFGYLVRLAQPYVSGLHQHNKLTQIYVSRGTGYWGPPMRLGAPSEVTYLTLKTC
ncbi:MAG TPA: metallophosphoesterase, partial [Myxococcales bacterium]|nr:metallophosphoesterase [Myxococcales bacterium]